jgi:hypothetical protein
MHKIKKIHSFSKKNSVKLDINEKKMGNKLEIFS